MTFSLDHLVVCVNDLSTNPYPLESIEGGRHSGHGTANRIVPLGDAYIELVAVVDQAEAASSPFGAWVKAHEKSGVADALCLRTREIDSMNPIAMSRVKPDGTTLSWRVAGLAEALSGHLPFFIQWDDIDLHPGRSDLNEGARLSSVTVSGNRQRLLALTGPIDRVTYVDGPPAIEFTVSGS